MKSPKLTIEVKGNMPCIGKTAVAAYIKQCLAVIGVESTIDSAEGDAGKFDEGQCLATVMKMAGTDIKIIDHNSPI